MKNKEKIYDEKISPLMKQIIEICKEHNMPVFALFRYSKTCYAKTFIPDNAHMGQHLMNIIHLCMQDEGVNMDKFLLSIMKQYPNKSSALLNKLGATLTPQTTHNG